MEEVLQELRSLKATIAALRLITAFVAIMLVGVALAAFQAAGKAGPRLLQLRKENEALHDENLRLRTELNALRKP